MNNAKTGQNKYITGYVMSLSHEERLKRVCDAQAAFDSGNMDEFIAIGKKIPMAPHIAKSIKEVMGVEFLKTAGFDLSLAEEKYGHDWLDR